MDKLLLYSGYDQFGPHVFPIEIGQRNGHIKLATEIHPKIAEYIASAKPIPGKTQLLIDALGAGEWWGSNKNGDVFYQDQLGHPGPDYGYETFMHYAYPYKHHVNKDPAQAYGDKVILSTYHPSMHRVQLIAAVHNDRCSDILHQVDNGEYPDVSMGCRVPYDQCSVCGNKAKNRSQYCDHLKYQMNRVLPDGRKVMAINWSPKFFDISFVLIGAEKASHVLMKVASQVQVPSSAELGEKYYSIPKNAEVKKKSAINKEVPMKVDNVQSIEPVLENAPLVKQMEPKLPAPVLNTLAGFPLNEIVSTLAFLGIDPKPEEFQKIILIKAGHRKLAEELDSKGEVFDEYSGVAPSNASQIMNISADNVSEKIAYLLRPYIADRSCFNDFLVARLDKYAGVFFAGEGEGETSPWYTPSPKTVLTSVPLIAGIAGLYSYLKNKAPETSITSFDRAILRHPWLLGLLLSAGAGAAVAGTKLLQSRPFGTGDNLDTLFGTGYSGQSKTASKKWLIPLALAPLAYMYSGVQRSRAMRGERLNKFDEFVARRPDIAAVTAALTAPAAMAKGQQMSRRLRQFLKVSSAYTDFGLFALTSGSKLLPAALAGSMIDAAVIKKITEIAQRRRKHGNAAGVAK